MGVFEGDGVGGGGEVGGEINVAVKGVCQDGVTKVFMMSGVV